MTRLTWGAVAGFVMSLLAFSTTLAAQTEGEVDLALVLAVDVSRSMDPEEQELQRQERQVLFFAAQPARNGRSAQRFDEVVQFM